MKKEETTATAETKKTEKTAEQKKTERVARIAAKKAEATAKKAEKVQKDKWGRRAGTKSAKINSLIAEGKSTKAQLVTKADTKISKVNSHLYNLRVARGFYTRTNSKGCIVFCSKAEWEKTKKTANKKTTPAKKTTDKKTTDTKRRQKKDKAPVEKTA